MSNPLDDLLSEDDLRGAKALSRFASNNGNLGQDVIGEMARTITKMVATADPVSNGYDQIRTLAEAASYLLLTIYASGMASGQSEEKVQTQLVASTRIMLGSIAVATQGMARSLLTDPEAALNVEFDFKERIKERESRSHREVLHDTLLLNNLDATC